MKGKSKALLNKFADIFRLIEDIIAVGGMVLFGAVIMVEIIKRVFGLSGISWLQEFSQLMFVLSVYIGCSRAVETDEHMAMDVLYRVVPEKYIWPLRSFVDLLMIGISGFLAYYSLKYTIYTYKMGTTTQTVSTIKMWCIWVPIVFCMFTMTLRYVLMFIKRLRESISKLHSPQANIARKEE